MKFRNLESAKLPLTWRIVAVAAFVCFNISGCRSGSSAKQDLDQSAQKGVTHQSAGQNTAPTSPASGPGIDLQCAADRIQNPLEAFHYSFKKVSSNPLAEDADITPQSIVGTFNNNGFSGSLHGTRSDAASWHEAQSHLMGIVGMASAVALVNNGSAVVREGPEKMNGYDTTKYSIDTTRGNSTEQGLYKSVLGVGGFEKGTAWVTAQGCPIKFSLASELHSRDGSVEKIDYEEAMIRK